MRVITKYLPKRIQDGVIIIKLPSVVLKLFMQHGKKRKEMEFKGYKYAISNDLWNKNIVEINEIPFGFYSRRGRIANDKDMPIIEEFLWNQFDRVKNELVPIYRIIDIRTIKRLEINGLYDKNLNYFLSKVENCRLPLSSSHGDFHKGNVVFINNRLCLIDWSMYRNKSSIFFDIMHFYIRNICEYKGISWTDALFIESAKLDLIINKFSLNLKQAQILYAIDRTCREIEQKDFNFRNLRIQKYLDTFKKLVQSYD